MGWNYLKWEHVMNMSSENDLQLNETDSPKSKCSKLYANVGNNYMPHVQV